MDFISENIAECTQLILDDYKKERSIDRLDAYNQPNKEAIIDITKKLLRILMPGYRKDEFFKVYNPENNLSALIEDVAFRLNKQICVAMKYNRGNDCTGYEMGCSRPIVINFLKTLPRIREYLDTDLQAAFDGDPAASSKDEIIFSYPGFYAIAVNRLAHELYKLKVPILPRIMTEHAHTITGIDIHPGAQIGKYFFIDHGTGVVIGETTVIGDHVKIYQGVTLGALSTKGGQRLRNKKRHPTIEDNVTIYSGASVLGGNTVIGKNVVIGGNVFITESVEENTKVSVQTQKLRYDRDEGGVRMEYMDSDGAWFYVI